jgi:hypothetical protein
MIESCLDSSLLSGDLGSPTDVDPGERLGNQKAIPGTEFPGAFRVDIEGSHGGVNEFGELRDTRFGHHRGAARAIRRDGAVAAGKISALKVSKANGTILGAGAANGDEAEAFDGASDQFAVEAAADENGDAVITKPPGTREQTTVPEGVDSGWWRVVTGYGVGITDVAISESDTETTDGHARNTGDDEQSDALFKGVGRSHE